MMKTINLVFLLKVLFVIVPLWVQIRKKSLPVHLPRRAGMQDLFLFEGCGACYSRFQRDYCGMDGTLITISSDGFTNLFCEFFPQIFLINFSQFQELIKKSQQIILE